MKRITRELIEEYFGEQKRIKHLWWGGWFIELESGASMTINRFGVHYGRYWKEENRAHLDKWLFRYEVLASIALAGQIWGGRGRRPRAAEAYAAMRKVGVLLGFIKSDRELVLEHFGPESTIKNSRHGLTITVPNRGYVKYSHGAIEKVCGDLLRPALEMIHEREYGKVVVRGKADLLPMAVREGRAIGITVTPESDLDTFITIAANCSVIVGMVIAFQWLDFWSSVFAGYVGGSFLCSLLFGVFAKPLQAMARRKGLEMVGLETSAPVRKASIDEVKKRGML